MIKILHFITDTNVGGAGRLLCNQIKNMAWNDFEISVALPKSSALLKELRGLPCSVIGCEHACDVSFSLDSVIEDYKIIKKVHPDIVHSHASLSSRIAASALGVPSRIFTRHCAFPVPSVMKSPMVSSILGACQGILSTHIIAVADAAKENLLDMGCNERMISTVINGVEPISILDSDKKSYLRAINGLDEGNFVVSIFARLEKYKGHRTLLDAAAICLKHFPDFRFFIVGDGSERDNLMNMARELKIEDFVHFLGFCEDISPILNITDVNVNCSYGTETSSLALSEGMSLGIPCVASNYGGNPHMVKNCINGLLFQTNNADALASCLIRLKCDKALYKECSAGAYKRYREEFNAQIMSQKMIELYVKEYQRHKNSARI